MAAAVSGPAPGLWTTRPRDQDPDVTLQNVIAQTDTATAASSAGAAAVVTGSAVCSTVPALSIAPSVAATPALLLRLIGPWAT